jgi:nucleoside-diphosphate-sugar epimerase
MHCLVTGARGFVGRGLIPYLAARGHTGIATGRSVPVALPAGWRGADRDVVLTGGRGATDATGVDTLVHLEVKHHTPRPTAADVAEFDRVNVQGTRAWLEWAARNEVRRILFVSSVKAVRPAALPRSEQAELETDAAYGASKARAEQVVREWAAADAARSAVILRPAPVYGPGNDANLAAFVRQIRAGKPCLVGAGATRKSIVSRTNLVAAVEFTARAARRGVEVFNVSDPEAPTLAELAGTIAGLAGAPPPRRIPTWAARVIARVGDAIAGATGGDFPLTTSRLRALEETSLFPCDKLVAAGFRHPQSTREGVAEMVHG